MATPLNFAWGAQRESSASLRYRRSATWKAARRRRRIGLALKLASAVAAIGWVLSLAIMMR